ncbi:Gfo/Idh/MocA family oxidoreductase [Plantibacter flavus]|uniref:Gfo/Idh/MocA family protein n=1 Tax=Plantibacter flavus TaxID=150123 RepID=UPI003F17DE11
MTTRTAVIGCGDISVVHLDAIRTVSGAELVAVCDVDPTRAASAAAANGVPAFGDLVELLDTVHPDVVHICTPHHTHADLAITALERGVSVVLEKPVAHTRADGERVIAAAAASGAKIAVCFQNRYNQPVQRLRELLDSGELGAVGRASASVQWHRTADYYLDRPWRGTWAGSGGGLLMNQAIHTLDLLQWFVGDVVTVDGEASTVALSEVIEVEDTAEIRLTHANGAESTFSATNANSWNAPIVVEVETERAVLRIEDGLTVRYADGTVETTPERATAAGERAYWGVSHELLVQDFYASLDDPEPFWISPAEAGKTLGIIQDVYDQSYPDRLLATTAGTGTTEGVTP